MFLLQILKHIKILHGAKIMKKSIYLKILTIGIPIVIAIAFILKDSIVWLMYLLPSCLFYQRFHLYCPACGNTRSILALSRGDIISSLRYNIVPTLLLITSIGAYVELASFSFGKHLCIFPRNKKFYITSMILFFIYFIFRNFIRFN